MLIKVLSELLWNVHAELDGLMLPAGNLVEDVLPGSGLAVPADVVRVGEGLAVLLGHLTKLALPGNE